MFDFIIEYGGDVDAAAIVMILSSTPCLRVETLSYPCQAQIYIYFNKCSYAVTIMATSPFSCFNAWNIHFMYCLLGFFLILPKHLDMKHNFLYFHIKINKLFSSNSMLNLFIQHYNLVDI